MTDSITTSAKSGLLSKLRDYLHGVASHDEISQFAWERVESLPEQPRLADVRYCSAIFTVIHLADSEHWNDGCTKRELEQIVEKLSEELDKNGATNS